MISAILFHAIRGLFFVFWFLFHVAIWIFAAVLTVFRFHSIENFSLENYAKAFQESVVLIENSDPLLLLIAFLLFIIIPCLYRMKKQIEKINMDTDKIVGKIKIHI